MAILRVGRTAALAAAIAAAAAAALLFAPLRTAFTVTQNPSGRLAFAAPVAPGDAFSIRFTHSVHLTPVEEQYRIGVDGALMLERVVYESYGIGNPSGTEPGESFRIEDGTLVIEGMQRRFPFILQRIGQIAANHELRIGGRTYSFAAWSEPGSRVKLQTKRVSIWNLWMLNKGGTAGANPET